MRGARMRPAEVPRSRLRRGPRANGIRDAGRAHCVASARSGAGWRRLRVDARSRRRCRSPSARGLARRRHRPTGERRRALHARIRAGASTSALQSGRMRSSGASAISGRTETPKATWAGVFRWKLQCLCRDARIDDSAIAAPFCANGADLGHPRPVAIRQRARCSKGLDRLSKGSLWGGRECVNGRMILADRHRVNPARAFAA